MEVPDGLGPGCPPVLSRGFGPHALVAAARGRGRAPVSGEEGRPAACRDLPSLGLVAERVVIFPHDFALHGAFSFLVHFMKRVRP